MKRVEDQVIALAGVVQAARLVDQVSRTGSYPEEFLSPLLNSLFVFDAQHTEEIYGSVAGVKLGLQNLAAMLASRNEPSARDMMRYVFGMLHLERRFSAHEDMSDVVRSRLEHTRFNADHFATHTQDVCHSLSGIYQDTLSTFKYRIRVTGSMQQLQNQTNANLIRALLLAGLRSAVLWRQLGGRRWRLVTHRRHLMDVAHNLSRQMGSV
ncbi:MAG: high frequency lysogenization protein HflD [Pseudomonadota bacterium]